MSQTRKYMGTTALPTKLMTTEIQTGNVETDNLVIGGSKINQISQSHLDSDPNSLASSFTLDQAQRNLLEAINQLEGTVSNTLAIPVLSTPIVSPTFIDLEKWILNGFEVDDGTLLYHNTVDTPGENNANFILNADAFTRPGTYYITITLNTTPFGGRLVIIDQHGTEVVVMSTVGTYQCVIDIEDPSLTQITFRADNITIGGEMIVGYCGVHYVRPEFSKYLELMISKISSGGSGFVTLDELNTALTNTNLALQEYITLVVTPVNDRIISHANDSNSNPHQITPDMIGAAKHDHTHAFADLDTFMDDIVEPLNKAVTDIKNLQDLLTLHFNNENPHQITPDMIGASPVRHIHQISDIYELSSQLTTLSLSIEAIREDLPEDSGSDVLEIYNRLNVLDSETALTNNTLNSHTLSGLEAHGTRFASSADGQSGIDTNSVMSPAVTKVAIESKLTKVEDAWRLQPSLVSRVQLSSTQKNIVVPLTYGSKYVLRLSGGKQHDLTSISMMTVKEVSPAPVTNYVVKTTIDNTLVREEGFDNHRLAIRMTSFKGEYHYDTYHDTLIGRGVCYSKGTEPAVPDDGPWDVKFISCPKDPVEVTSINSIQISTTDATIDAVTIIEIYELVPYQEYPIATNADPAGTVKMYVGNPIIMGYSKLDGSVLDRNEYAALYNHAFLAGTIISQSTYDSLISTTGKCDRFGDGDGNTTFTLPTMSVEGINYFIKLRNEFLSSSLQVLYELDWNR